MSLESLETSCARPGVLEDINRLLEEQKRVREEKKQLAKDLRNAQRRRRRLKHKARLLSQADLAQVLALRQEEESERARRPAKRAKGEASHQDTRASELTATNTAEEPEATEREHGEAG